MRNPMCVISQNGTPTKWQSTFSTRPGLRIASSYFGVCIRAFSDLERECQINSECNGNEDERRVPTLSKPLRYYQLFSSYL